MEEKVLLLSDCSLYRVTTAKELDSFSCGENDLDEFFHKEANHIPSEENLESRMMYLDLLGYKTIISK